MTRAVRRWAVVLAAGRGERFGSPVPKQYQRLLGCTVLDWSLAALLAESSIASVTVALARGDRRWQRTRYARHPRVATCIGGERRERSLANALEHLSAQASAADWVLVQDAARPCLQPRDLRRLLATTRRDPVGGLLAIPVTDTLKRSTDGRHSDQTIDRRQLWRAATPQVFRYGLLKRALALCLERGRRITDEAAAIEILGLRPRLVPGSSDNIKVTETADLALAAAVLRARRRRA
jgi:2-C-methyl-D-erythritol 4-phosphate cytidylyltransferase